MNSGDHGFSKEFQETIKDSKSEIFQGTSTNYKNSKLLAFKGRGVVRVHMRPQNCFSFLEYKRIFNEPISLRIYDSSFFKRILKTKFQLVFRGLTGARKIIDFRGILGGLWRLKILVLLMNLKRPEEDSNSWSLE